jgi:hypothetical protein
VTGGNIHTDRQTHNIVFINKGTEADTKFQMYVGWLWWGLILGLVVVVVAAAAALEVMAVSEN